MHSLQVNTVIPQPDVPTAVSTIPNVKPDWANFGEQTTPSTLTDSYTTPSLLETGTNPKNVGANQLVTAQISTANQVGLTHSSALPQPTASPLEHVNQREDFLIKSQSTNLNGDLHTTSKERSLLAVATETSSAEDFSIADNHVTANSTVTADSPVMANKTVIVNVTADNLVIADNSEMADHPVTANNAVTADNSLTAETSVVTTETLVIKDTLTGAWPLQQPNPCRDTNHSQSTSARCSSSTHNRPTQSTHRVS